MSYDFIGTLTESHLIPSQASLRQYTAEELADLSVLYICALYVLFNFKDSERFAEQYAKRTIQHGTDFHKWSSGATDLYVMLYGLQASDVHLDDQERSDKFKNVVPLGESLLVRWLTEMSRGNVRDTTHRSLFTRLDFNFKTSNSSIRAVRRLIMDWHHLNAHERQLAATRLLQLIRVRASRGELFQQLRVTANRHDLEIDGACDVETGHGCEVSSTSKRDAKAEKKRGPSFLSVLAGIGLGIAVTDALRDGKKK
jgi:hypothetical protein